MARGRRGGRNRNRKRTGVALPSVVYVQAAQPGASRRDPRVDPRKGDAIQFAESERRVVAVDGKSGVEFAVWYRGEFMGMDRCTLAEWQRETANRAVVTFGA